MSTPYKVSVNDFFHFEMDSESISKLDAVAVDRNSFHILHQNTPYKAQIVSANFHQKKYTVVVNGNSYTVMIEDELDQLIKEMGFETAGTKQVNEIKAPMPGLILEINVEVGQKVKENDPLLILEAMKMENSFHSPREGVIKLITVSKGDAVEKGQLLIVFE
jgi:biotin carboxyl carrier protein